MTDVSTLVNHAAEGNPRAVARLISLIEDGSPLLREIAAELALRAGRAIVIGITGSPGAGKSTITSGLLAAFRATGKRVGVLAVDPSSPFSGGALLGDRVRMQEHSGDRDVFIRSMASRGHLGGLAWATPQAVRVLEAAGCEVILIETVGVGQAEVDIASLADTTVVLLVPGMGDGIQAAKAGILEVADIFCVNKADRPGADDVVRNVRGMLALGGRHSAAGAWRPSIVKSIAIERAGIDELIAALDKHRDWLIRTGELEKHRQARAAREIQEIVLASFRATMTDLVGKTRLDDEAALVCQGKSDPYSAADRIKKELVQHQPNLGNGQSA